MSTRDFSKTITVDESPKQVFDALNNAHSFGLGAQIGNQESGVGNRQSGIGSRKSAVRLQSIDFWLLDAGC